MSDDEETGWQDVGEGDPDLESEEGRDSWINFLLDQNAPEDWVQCQVLHDGTNLIGRFRWADGTEEVFDCHIRRNMQVVRPTSEEGAN